jgi:cytochrome c oxidase subunit 4
MTSKGIATAWRRNIAVWAGLLVLLGLSVWTAYLPLGRYNVAINLGIAVVQAAMVGVFSMGLDRTTALNRLTAAAGFLFILVLFTFTLSDLFTRY